MLLNPSFSIISAERFKNVMDSLKDEVLIDLRTPDEIKNHPALKGLDLPRLGQPGRTFIGVLTTKNLVVAGMMIAPVVFLDVHMMSGVLLYAFAAAVLGGVSSAPGAVAGGFAGRR